MKLKDQRLPVYKSKTSTEVVKYIELEHFVSVFQDLYNEDEIERVYYDENGKIVALENDGDIFSDII